MRKINQLMLIAFMSVIGIGTANAQCTASFSAVDNGSGNYMFTSTGSGGLSFDWSIDNSYYSGTSISQTLTNGTYQICLYISDSLNNCLDTDCQTITVTSGQAPACNANFTSNNGNNGYMSFTTISSNYNSATWDYGDGSTGSTMDHTYSSNGQYTVCLTVGDSNTCTDTYCDSIVITNANGGGQGVPCNLVAGVSYTDNGSGNYSFNSTTTGSPDYEVWSFGDGSSDTGGNVSHTFPANGTYTVSLYVSDSLAGYGCDDYALVTIIVTGVSNPVACQSGFTIYTDSLTNGVNIINSSTGNNLTYSWDFGDGNSSTLQYPNYTYTAYGPYNLCLTVNGNGCTSTYCDSIGSGGIVLRGAGGFSVNVIAPSVTGINEVENVSRFEVFPNPIRGNVNIEFNLVNNANVEVFVTDLLGNRVALVVSKEMNVGNNKINYNVSDISNGIYLLNIKTNNSLQVKKIVVNK